MPLLQNDLAPLLDLLEPSLKEHAAASGPIYVMGDLGMPTRIALSQAISLKRIADSLAALVQQRDADAIRPPQNVDFDIEPLRAKAPWYKPQSTHPDGWFMHNPGDPMPVGGDVLVDVRMRDGTGATSDGDSAGSWFWGKAGSGPDYDVVRWRYHRP